MFKFVVLLALVPAIFATSGVSRCRSGAEMPTYINIENCDVAPCRIPLGSTARMLLGFSTPRDVESFTPRVQAGVLGLWIDYPLPNEISEGCDNLQDGARCPLSAHEDVEYLFNFDVAEAYPRINVDIELTLNDAEGVLNCVNVPITVVD